MRQFKIVILFCILSVCGVEVFAQHTIWEQAERCSSDSLSKYCAPLHLSTNWIKGTNRFYYYIEKNKCISYYLFDAESSKKTFLFSTDILAKKLSSILGKSLTAEKCKLYNLDFSGKDFLLCTFKLEGRSFQYDLKTDSFKEVTLTPKANDTKLRPSFPSWKKISPDSTYYIYGIGHNLYVNRLKGNEPRCLANNGELGFSYNASSKEVSDTSKVYTSASWIPNSNIVLSFREDKRKVGTMTIINSLKKPRPEADTFKMPMPGDKEVSQYDLNLFNIDTKQHFNVNLSKYADQKVEQVYIPTQFAAPNSVFITRRSRPMDKIDLCRIDTRTGKLTELLSEESKPHLNLQLFNYHILNKGNDIIWWSERTGKGHYYLYDKNGKLVNAITSGDYVAGKIHSIDTIARTIVFEGYGKDKALNPSYKFYYKVGFDGKGFTQLTFGNGNHDISFSENKKYLLDIYSRMDMFPITQVVKVGSKKTPSFIYQASDSLLRSKGWQPPVLLKMKAADDKTDLFGLMYLPFDLDKSKSYPIITNVYPGPQDDQIPLSFTFDENCNQSLAQLGFVVINIAGRGSSPYRGHDFHCFGYGNMRDYPLADDKYVIKELASKYPFIDLNRVGIYGHSGGGFMTAAAMLKDPDFYKVGIAASGNHDNNIYIQWWGEAYSGVVEKKDSITGKSVFTTNIPTNIELAGNLKGRLLLITGDVDKNVPPSSTYRLADALIKSNKRFDMMVIPGADHGLMSPYYYNMIRYYFVEHLLKKECFHIDIVNHK